MSRMRALQNAVQREARRFSGKMAVYLHRLEDGPTVEVRADAPQPLASVFKIGVLVELFRRIDRQEIRLDERWTVRPQLQSLESGVLMFLGAGLRPTVRDLATLMIIVSDNTATDMIFKRLGIRSVNPTLRRLGLTQTDIYIPNREWYLLILGYHPRFRELPPGRLARAWEGLGPEERLRELEWLMAHRRKVTVEAMRDRYLRLERSGATTTAGWRAMEEATDNMGSAQDIGTLLALIHRGRAASRPSCRTMLSILEQQQYRHLAEGLPTGTRVASKTGGIVGVVNDAGIVYPPKQLPFVGVCLTEDLGRRDMALAPTSIARIARAAWRTWGT